MFELTLDLKDFERKARELGKAIDQVPFALASVLNDAAFATRASLIADTWPRQIKVRQPNFLKAALHVDKADKHDLSVAIRDTLGRGHLALHAKGGTKQARGLLAIPTKGVREGAKSRVIASQRPGVLKRKVVKGNLIFQAQGRGKNSKLRLMYKLQGAARIKKDVPFYEDFARRMREEVVARFPGAMRQAMRTRR